MSIFLKGEIKMDNKKHDPLVDKVINAFNDKVEKKTDPLGMYTGRPEKIGEQPIQDADDL